MIPVGLFLPVIRAKRPDKRARTAWAAGKELLHDVSQLRTGLRVAEALTPARGSHARLEENKSLLPATRPDLVEPPTCLASPA